MPRKNKKSKSQTQDEMFQNLNNMGINAADPNETGGFSMNNINEENREELRMQMDPNAIPDLDAMLEHIQDLLADIETPVMQELEKADKKRFEMVLTHKYYNEDEKLGITSNKIINMFLAPERYDNLEIFLDMCEDMKKVKDGKVDIKEAHKTWCEKMNNKFLYSKFGGKEEFEQKMKDMQNKPPSGNKEKPK